jgi:hypothetical protein
MRKLALPDAAYLRECFDYDPDTGFLIWKTRPREHFANDGACRRWNGLHAGGVAGGIGPGGYLIVEIKAVPYRVHRIIWKLLTGQDPDNEIDHKNKEKTDNRRENLREATPQQNCFNQPKRRKTSDLPTGVYFNRGRYISQVRPHAKAPKVHLGCFSTPEEAHAAYLAYVIPIRGEFFSEQGNGP